MKKEKTVICEEEMRNFRTISHNGDTFDVSIYQGRLKFGGECLCANGKKEKEGHLAGDHRMV